EGAHDVAEEPGGQDRRPFVVALGGSRDADGQLEIGPRQMDLVRCRADEQTGQDRERTRSGGHRSPGAADGLAQDITLAAELHWPSLAFFSRFFLFLSSVV